MLLIFLVLVTGLCVTVSEALRGLNFKGPEAVKVGDDVTLTCDYELEGVALYSIRWYRYEVEFYRYLPKESPPTKVFPVKYVRVDMFRSNSRNVTLVEVERETAGVFKCEVTSDAPLFHTQIGFAKLLVAEIPDEDPVLRTNVHKVSPGTMIRANCTAPGSYPKMNVTWFINEAEVRPEHNIQTENVVLRYEALPGVETVHSTLKVRAIQELFRNNRIKLKCLATMFTMYNRSKDVELQEYPAQLALVMMPTTDTMKGTAGDYRQMLVVHFGMACITMWLCLTIF